MKNSHFPAVTHGVKNFLPSLVSVQWLQRGALAASVVLLVGCASTSAAPTNPKDPFERYNRSMSNFNETIDKAALKPVATAYEKVVPAMARTGVSNFFSNLSDGWSFVNSTLQGDMESALNSITRFNVNTFFGLGGLLDIASEMQIDRNPQDFGLTLGAWGVPTGPYLVLPLLGPSTVRDTIALPVDVEGNLVTYVDPVSARNSLYALRIVNVRANLLRASNVLDSAALDKYSFTRDVYLQLRNQRNTPDDSYGKDGGYIDNGAGVLPKEPY